VAKVVLVFKGDYNHEKNLPTETIPLSALNLDYNTKSIDFAALGLPADCSDCRVNAYAAQGYLEAKAATNDFAVSVAKYQVRLCSLRPRSDANESDCCTIRRYMRLSSSTTPSLVMA
jgi:hypothetical protein